MQMENYKASRRKYRRKICDLRLDKDPKTRKNIIHNRKKIENGHHQN